MLIQIGWIDVDDWRLQVQRMPAEQMNQTWIESPKRMGLSLYLWGQENNKIWDFDGLVTPFWVPGFGREERTGLCQYQRQGTEKCDTKNELWQFCEEDPSIFSCQWLLVIVCDLDSVLRFGRSLTLGTAAYACRPWWYKAQLEWYSGASWNSYV